MNLGSSYCFDDILMEPLFSDITTRSSISLETNIATNGRSLVLKTPLISSPMDTVTETDMAIKMALNGGLGIIHRYMDIDSQVSQVIKVKRFLQYIIQKPYTLTIYNTLDEIMNFQSLYNVSSFCVIDNSSGIDKLLGILTRRDIDYMKHCQNYYNANMSMSIKTMVNISDFMSTQLITIDILNIKNNYNVEYTLENTIRVAKDLMYKHKIEKIPIVSNNSLVGLITLKNIRHYDNNKFKACIDNNGALCVGAAIGIVDDYIERLSQLVEAGVDLICIDVANGFNINVFNAINIIRSKYPLLVLMVGNVCNWNAYAALSQYDVDCVRVGVGNGSICTTRLETGIGKGQFSAVIECFQYKINVENANRIMPNIICDGGSLGKTGNKVKALACGASAIMLGRTLASTEESPGIIIYRNGKRFKYIRGMASSMANLSKQEKTNSPISTISPISPISTNSLNSLNSTISSTNSKPLTYSKHSEGVDGEQELSGSVVDVIEQINGGIKSGMSYLGCINIKQLHDKSEKGEIKFNLVTSIGMSENGIRVKTY